MSRTQKRQVSKSVYHPSGSLTGQSGSRYSSSVEFNPDYTHVVTDLKRIGILMGSFTVILIALSFFL